MVGILRVVRGFIGLLWVLQSFGLVIALLWQQMSIAGLVAYLLSGAAFFGLRSVINRLHLKKHGVRHPALAENPWAF